MHATLSPIKEDSMRDYRLHYDGTLVYDQEDEVFAEVLGFDDTEAVINYEGGDPDEPTRKGIKEFTSVFLGAVIPDQFVQIGPICVYITRHTERKYKKASCLNNLNKYTPCKDYLRNSKHHLNFPRHISTLASNVFTDKRYTLNEAVKVLSAKKAASVKLTDDVAIARFDGHQIYALMYKTKRVGLVHQDTSTVLFVPELKEYFEELGII